MNKEQKNKIAKKLKGKSPSELELRYDELCLLARNRFIEQSNYSIFDWLEPKEAYEFEKIQFLLGETNDPDGEEE